MILRKLMAVLFAIAAGIGITAAKGNRVIREFNNLEKFDRIEISTGGDVTYTIGSTRSVSATLNGETLSDFEVSVEGGTLYVGVKKNSSRGINMKNYKADVKITGPALKGITANIGSDITVVSPFTVPGGVLKLDITTSAEVEFKGAVKCQSLNADVNTAGELEIESLTAESVKATISCGGSIDLAGSADKVNFDISMGGSLNASGLKAKSGSANVTMGGSIKCNVAKLDYKTTMGGSVRNIN